jgi:CheY-like chemotaxis protein
VVLDLAMPEMSGLEAIPLIKERSPGTGIAVFTGVSDMQRSAIELGVDQCIEKGQPLDYVSLIVRRIGLERRMHAT